MAYTPEFRAEAVRLYRLGNRGLKPTAREIGVHNDGEFIEWTNFLHTHWNKLIKKLELPKAKFHSLRHLFGSTLIDRGVPVPVVSKLMGHANTAITNKIYAHALESTMKGIHDTLDNIFGESAGENLSKNLSKKLKIVSSS